MVMTLSRIHQHFGIIARLRPALLLAVGALVYALMNPRYLNTGKLFEHWPAKVILGLTIMACLSVPFGLSIGNSVMFILTHYSKVLIFAFLLIAAMRSVRDLYLFVWGFVISSGILVWMAWFVFGLRKGSSGVRLSHLYTWDANDVGCILLTALPLTLLTYQSSRGRGRILSLIIMAGIGATIARTGSRGAFLGSLVVGVALLLLLRQISPVKRLLFVVIAGSALVLTAPEGYWDQMRTMTSPKEDYNWNSAYGRREVWKRGIGYMFSSPLLGIGVDNFQHAEGSLSWVVENYEESGGRGKIKWSAAHNSFLQAGAELGIPGLILFTWLVFGGVFALPRLRRRRLRGWARGDPEQRFIYNATLYLPVSLIGFAVTSFFLSFAYIEIVYILAAYVTGVYVAVDAKQRELGLNRAPATRPPRPGRVRPPAWRQMRAARGQAR
jgi:O-antigen ligase